jgi:hypothetical protein
VLTHCPIAIVTMSGLMARMVSKIAVMEYGEPPAQKHMPKVITNARYSRPLHDQRNKPLMAIKSPVVACTNKDMELVLGSNLGRAGMSAQNALSRQLCFPSAQQGPDATQEEQATFISDTTIY